MFKTKRSFFERLTGSASSDVDAEEDVYGEESADTSGGGRFAVSSDEEDENQNDNDNEEGQLGVDVFKTDSDIIVQTIVAGVRSDMMDISITRDTVSIKGRRENARRTGREEYVTQELYWGSFSRLINLPEEIDQDAAEATIKNGMLTIKLPLLNKHRVQKIKVREE